MSFDFDLNMWIWGVMLLCLAIIRWPVYWSGRFLIWFFLGRKAEFEPFGFEDNFFEETYRSVQCRRRGKLFITDTICMLTGVVVWITVSGVLWYYFSNYPPQESIQESIKCFFQKWIYDLE